MGKSIKMMYTLSIFDTREVEEEEIKKDEKGKEFKVTEKKEKKVPVEIGLRNPTRVMQDEAELYEGAEIKRGLDAGMISSVSLAKRYNNEGGVLSDDQTKEYTEALEKLNDLKHEYDRVFVKRKKTKKDEERLSNIYKKVDEYNRIVYKYENSQQNLFNKTAEGRAKNKLILWWLLNLSYVKDEKGEWKPLIDGDSFLEKLEKYDEKSQDENNPFFVDAASKLLLLVTLWFNGNSPETFDDLIKELEAIDQEPQPEKNEKNGK